MHSIPKLIDETRMAKLLGCHPRTLLRLRREGKLPYLKVGERVRYDAEAVFAALPHFRMEPAAPEQAR